MRNYINAMEATKDTKFFINSMKTTKATIDNFKSV